MRTRDQNSVIKQHTPTVYRLALKLLHNREDAQETAQDVLLRVVKSLDQFRGDAEVSTWIHRITVNACIDRRRKKESPVTDDLEELESPEMRVADPDPNPEELYIRKETSARLRGMIALLPAREAMAITLYYFEGFDYAEIAATLQIPEGSVATALARGRQRLETCLLKIQMETD